MPFLLGAVLVITLVLALKGSGRSRGGKHGSNVLIGSIVVGIVVLLTMRAGVSWLGIATALAWAAAQRLRAKRPPEAGAQAGAGPRAARRMTKEEALEVLGLGEDASPERILNEYRRLMKKVHPDLGGSTYLAARLNEARDVLLGGK